MIKMLISAALIGNGIITGVKVTQYTLEIPVLGYSCFMLLFTLTPLQLTSSEVLLTSLHIFDSNSS